ncbi:hypothetical protein CAEBREN_20218 [Caenorhabditis brenneri]|uniref:Cation efflux protein transmembrane domain-containing protein n=1 Tax=Caenorhabditis brenneri TaxID=135651 RepID=G0N587_CAEBE|nr:hypothetical protein CAEBREN_20218 [Caenorhabditis brenneri]
MSSSRKEEVVKIPIPQVVNFLLTKKFKLPLFQSSSRAPSTLNILKMTNKKEFAEYVIMIIVNLANVGLVLIKGVTAYISSSFSIGTSAIESFGDVFVSFLLLIQLILDKRVKKSEYPRGRSSESTTNLTASVVMMALAFVNFIQSFDAVITGKLDPEFGIPHIAVVVVNILVKIFLFFKSDFFGALIIFLIIVRNWAPIVSESWFKLQGVKGNDDINKKVAKIISDNVGLFILISGYVTYHIGNKTIVEIYCEVENQERRSEIHTKFEDEEILAVYLLPLEDSNNMSLLPIQQPEEENPKSTETETVELLQKV